MVTGLPALAGHHQGAVPALNPERLDIGVRSFADPSPVEDQQADQRVFRRRAGPGGGQQRAGLAAVQSCGARFLGQARPAACAAGQ